ncbi:MAG: hypothetical protein H0V17_25185 [Deltaproteobacteria bacterium]|nr:hypothetical protein [Deltaproteobacteria bacterium]
MRARLLACAIWIGVVACGSSNPPDPDVDSSGPADGVPPTEVQFQRDVVPILNRSCGSGTEGCHHRKTYGASVNMDCMGWLSLENAPLGAQFYGGPSAGQSTGCPDKTLHERLLQITVWQCRDGGLRNYVKAGDLASSYLINKIRGTNLCNADGSTNVSDQMPPPPPAAPFAISEGDILTLEAWVTAGAKND